MRFHWLSSASARTTLCSAPAAPRRQVVICIKGARSRAKHTPLRASRIDMVGLVVVRFFTKGYSSNGSFGLGGWGVASTTREAVFRFSSDGAGHKPREPRKARQPREPRKPRDVAACKVSCTAPPKKTKTTRTTRTTKSTISTTGTEVTSHASSE
eukprot:6492549-Amphidinium_carterae.2